MTSSSLGKRLDRLEQRGVAGNAGWYGQHTWAVIEYTPGENEPERTLEKARGQGLDAVVVLPANTRDGR